MTKYSLKEPLVLRIMMHTHLVLGSLSIYWEKEFPWSSGAFGVGFLVEAIVCLILPWRHFAFQELEIDDHTISKKLFGTFRICSIDYDKVFVGSYELCGRLYKVFSQENIDGKTKKEIQKLVRSKKAFLFPWIEQMNEDYPELFCKE